MSHRREVVRVRALAAVLAGILALALAAPAAAAPGRFPDVEGHWAQAEIERGAGLGFLEGYPDGLFRPEGTVTRAEFVKMVAAAFGLEGHGAAVFEDARGRWFEPYVVAACEEGVVVPDELGGFFLPDEAIPRAEAAAYLVRALGRGGSAALRKAEECPFTDIALVPGAWRGAVAEAYLLGVLKGYPDGTVAGRAGSTRAEAVSMLLRALDARGRVLEVPPAKAAPARGEVTYATAGTLLVMDVDANRTWDVPGEGGFTLSWSPGRDVCVEGKELKTSFTAGTLPDPGALVKVLAALPSPGSPHLTSLLAVVASPWPREVGPGAGESQKVQVDWGAGEESLAVVGSASGPRPAWGSGAGELRRDLDLQWEARSAEAHGSGDLAATIWYDARTLWVSRASLLVHGAWEGEGTRTVASGQFDIRRVP